MFCSEHRGVCIITGTPSDIITQRNFIQYSKVSFCDGSFYDDSLIRLVSSRTEHSRLAVHHYRNSSILPLFSALLALFRCARVSSFSILAQFFWVDSDFPTHDVHQKDRKEEQIKTVDITFFPDVFWTTAWAFFNKIKSLLFFSNATTCS